MEKYEYSSGAPQMMESTQTKTYPKRRHKYAAFLCALFVFMVCSGFSVDFRLPSDPLKLASAYGDTQATHPSVLHFDEPWNGYTFWIAYSPYPEADDSKENPHILASNDGVNWVLPSGFTNPLMIRLKTINSTFVIIVIRNWFIIATQMNWNAGGDMLTTVKIR